MNTKEKILKSALKLFSQHGFDATSTSSISKDAGIGTGTLFLHFKTKKELYEAIYLEIKSDCIGSISRILNPNESTQENIKLISKYLIEFFLHNIKKYEFLKIAESSPHISKKTRESSNNYFDSLLKYLNSTKAKKELKKIDPVLQLSIIWELCIVNVEYLHSKRKKEATDEYLEIIWDSVKL